MTERSNSQGTQTSKSTSKSNALAPANSFIEVLEGMSIDTEDLQEHSDWTRPALPEMRERRRSIKLQKIDIREANEATGRSQIHLFGVTKDGFSILVQVLDFAHYFYYPAPQGFLEDDLDPLCEYINSFNINSPAISEIQLENQSTTPDGRPLQFLKISLFDHREMRRVKGIFTSGHCQYRDLFTSPELSYEASVPYFLRFMLDTSIASMTWLQLPQEEYEIIPPERRVSCCQLEVSISLESLRICDVADNRENDQMPDARHEAILQIGNMVSILDQDTPSDRIIFTLGTCSPISGIRFSLLKRNQRC
ncbi:ribonuclease H-like domain-containing protein [Pholiota molesta]|nr:ribonuclease H-like domain-containing protein [Pholiota molesta]